MDGQARKRVLIILPVFREKEGLSEFLASMTRVLNGLESEYEFEILLVIDPAGDGTELVAGEAVARNKNVNMLIMSRRFGHQAALLAGIDASEGFDAAIMLDSDGQHPVGLIADLLGRWRDGADIVQTLRQRGDSKAGSFFSRAYYAMMRSLGGVQIESGAADFRLLGRRVLEVLRDGIRERKMFLRGMIYWLGFNYAAVPYEPKARIAGTTKYKLSNLLDFGFLGLFNFTSAPLRLMMIAGASVSLLAFVVLVAQLFGYFLAPQRAVNGWASLFTIISFFGGVQMLCLGVIGEYVGQIFDEVKARPRYVISKAEGPLFQASGEGRNGNPALRHSGARAEREHRLG